MLKKPQTARILATAAAMLVLTTTAEANRRLIGTVLDSDGKPIKGVTVTLFDVGGSAPEIRTDRSAANAEGVGSQAHGTHNDDDWSASEGAMSYDDRSGIWHLTVAVVPGRYRYRFVVDGSWVEDPAAPCEESAAGYRNSIVEVAGARVVE